jgi:hypothetical protein
LGARLGDAVAFSSRTPFGDTVGSGAVGQTQYVARRTDAGWVTHAITPTGRPDALHLGLGGTTIQLYSEDLRTAIIKAYDLPGAIDDTPFRFNLYAEDTATRQLETIGKSQVDALNLLDFNGYPTFIFWGISADARHVTFVTSPDPVSGTVTRFLPDAAPGVPNVYEWDNGVLRVAGVLPDGSVPPGGSNMPQSYRETVSADGARVVFTASSPLGPSQLFMRIGASRTAWISQPELTDDPLDPTDDAENESNSSSPVLQAVTPDGRTVFFTTDAGLVDQDTNGLTDLYRYTESGDPSRDSNLTLISHEGDLDGAEVSGMSDDGERVYYHTLGDNLVVWDHGTTKMVIGGVPQQTTPARSLGVKGYAPGSARVTPDGTYFAFIFGTGDQHTEMYLYSLRDGTVTCCSCPAGPPSYDATVLPAATEGTVTLRAVGSRPRFLSDAGHVFFSTAEELVPEDRNGVLDTYEYDPVSRAVSLVSTGTGSDPSTFADASASGDDVFFLTRQRLTASDSDDLVDVYDARDGSSLNASSQPMPVCEDATCQPPLSPSPHDDALGNPLSDEGGHATGSSKLLAVPRRALLHGTSGALRVRFIEVGRLSWSGRGVHAGLIRHGKRGSHAVRLRLKRAARAHLRMSGSYTTSVHLRFVSAGGDGAERTVRVTFRAVRKGR